MHTDLLYTFTSGTQACTHAHARTCARNARNKHTRASNARAHVHSHAHTHTSTHTPSHPRNNTLTGASERMRRLYLEMRGYVAKARQPLTTPDFWRGLNVPCVRALRACVACMSCEHCACASHCLVLRCCVVLRCVACGRTGMCVLRASCRVVSLVRGQMRIVCWPRQRGAARRGGPGVYLLCARVQPRYAGISASLTLTLAH